MAAAAAGERLSFDSALAATLPRLEVNIFFEKRTKNGTEVFPRKEICILF